MMHHPADSDEIPPPDPVHYAEQALLGALLFNPRQLHRANNLLPGHFADPAHRALYAAMRTLIPPPPEVHRREPVWVNAVLAHAVVDAPGLTVAHAHALVDACPNPAHVGAYALMIRAGHLRRTLREPAQRLAQTATDSTLPDPTTTVLEEAGALARLLDQLAVHWRPHTGALPRTSIPAAAPRAATADEREEERLFLAASTAQPHALRTLPTHLQPEDFTDPLHQQLYRCLTALAHRSGPIDPVTVLWEAQHRGLLAHRHTPPDIVAAVSDPAGSAEHWAEQIPQRALLARAQATASIIATLTDDPTNTPHQLINRARHALSDFITQHTRRRGRPPSAPATRELRARPPSPPRATIPGEQILRRSSR
ncbi:DnaB-like helicase N-terminal domain-containing protein [Streptomyces olivoreticuli]